MKIIINYKLPIIKDNKIIKLEKSAKYIIELSNLTKNIQGGDIFENLNLDDIIIKKETKSDKSDKSDKLDKSNKSITSDYLIDDKLIKKHKIKIIKDKLINTYNINNLQFSTLNSIYDLKLLIYYLLNINIENQYLYSIDYPTLFYNYQNIITQESIDINLESNINNPNIKYFNNIPIDFDLINNRHNYIISTFEKNTYLNQIFNEILGNNKILELDLINLNDIINKETINLEIQKDDELLNIIYNGFIEKFFPYYDDNLFLLYINKDNKYLEYPNLKIKSDSIINKCANINNIYSKDINKLTKNLNLSSYYKKIIYQISSFNDIKNINLQEIFNNIEIIKFKNLKKIELQLLINDNFIYFNKINIINKYSLNLENLYINNKTYNTLLNTNYINNKNLLLFLYNIKSEKENIDDDIFILLDEYFNIFIIYNINKFNIIDLSNYENLLIKNINELLKLLYSFNILKNKKEINLLNLNLISYDYQLLFNENL